MARSNPFPSFFDPRKLWVITDVWDSANPYTDRLIISPDTGLDYRETTTLGYHSPEEVHPIYRIEENGIDIGWVVFSWIDLSDNNPFLYGYEFGEGLSKPIVSSGAISAFIVSSSTRTDYRCPILTLTGPIDSNVMWAITVENIEGQTYGPEPQPALWSDAWSSTVPTVTPVVPITQYGINRTVIFRAWMKRADVSAASMLASCIVNFPAPLTGFLPQVFLPGYSG